jgi:RND family efflux transporter MFP subunit
VRGERLEPDSQLALLGDTKSLWVWVDLYESHLERVSDALAAGVVKAEITVNAFPDRTFTGHLDFLDRAMSETTRTIKARIVLENPKGLLRPGMFALVSLNIGAASSGLTVPRGAVLSDDGRDFVFVMVDDEYFVRRPVSVGRDWNGYIEIRSGLEAGQTVAAAGTFLLKSDVLRSKMGAGCAD